MEGISVLDITDALIKKHNVKSWYFLLECSLITWKSELLAYFYIRSVILLFEQRNNHIPSLGVIKNWLEIVTIYIRIYSAYK